MYEHTEPIGNPLTNEEMDQLIYGRGRSRSRISPQRNRGHEVRIRRELGFYFVGNVPRGKITSMNYSPSTDLLN
jgi:hypothetical protein